MEANSRIASACLAYKTGVPISLAVLFWLLGAGPGVCMSPQPSAKEADMMAALHQAGLNKDRAQLPALLAALQKPDDPIKRSYAFVALHGLAQMGATEALPAIGTLLTTSHDTSLVNFAAASKARILAENGAQAIKDPKVRAQAKLAALYQQTKLTPDALNLDARYYQAHIGNPGEPVPVGVCLMREAADVLYQEGVASASLEVAPPDYSLDPAAALKVQMAPLSPKARVSVLIGLLANIKKYTPSEPYATQLLADMGLAAEQAVDAKLVDMDLHQEQYDGLGFRALFNVLYCIGDSSQSSFVEDLARDQSREVGYTAALIAGHIVRGDKVLFAVGY